MDDLLRYLLTCCLVGTITILVLTLIRHFLGKRISPAVMVFLWVLVGLRFLAPALLPVENFMPARPVPGATKPETLAAETSFPPETTVLYVTETTPETVVPETEPATPETMAELPPYASVMVVQPAETQRETIQEMVIPVIEEEKTAPVAEEPIPWTSILAVLWLTGSLCLTMWFLVTYIRLRLQLRGGIPCTDHDLPHLVRSITVQKLPSLSSPMTIGILRPLILVPAEGETDKAVLYHEFSHIRRWDGLTKLFVLAIGVLYWWNPAVWLYIRLVHRDMELACDRAALRMLTEPDVREYGRILLTYAEKRQLLRVGLHFGQSGLKERIDMLLDKRKTSPVLCVVLCVGMLLTLVCCGPIIGDDMTELQAVLAEETAKNAVLEASLADAQQRTAALQVQLAEEQEMQTYLRTLLSEKASEKEEAQVTGSAVYNKQKQLKQDLVQAADRLEQLETQLPFMYITGDTNPVLRTTAEEATIAELEAVIQQEKEKIATVQDILNGLQAIGAAEGSDQRYAKEMTKLTAYLTAVEAELVRFEMILSVKQAG